MRATKHIHGVSSFGHGSMSYVLVLLSLITLLTCSVACRDGTREAVDPIAVPETAFTEPSAPSQGLAWHEIPPINYIRKEIPAAKAPEIRGHYYQALVPDTCNLEERARPPEAARIKQLPLSKRKALDVTWIVTGLSQYYRSLVG